MKIYSIYTQIIRRLISGSSKRLPRFIHVYYFSKEATNNNEIVNLLWALILVLYSSITMHETLHCGTRVKLFNFINSKVRDSF